MSDVLCTLTLKWSPGTLSPNHTRGRHWGELQAAKEEAQLCAHSAWTLAGHPEIREPVVIDVLVRRYYRGKVPMDRDNLIAALKATVDELVRRGMFKDDGPGFIAWGEIEQDLSPEFEGPRARTILTVRRRAE